MSDEYYTYSDDDYTSPDYSKYEADTSFWDDLWKGPAGDYANSFQGDNTFDTGGADFLDLAEQLAQQGFIPTDNFGIPDLGALFSGSSVADYLANGDQSVFDEVSSSKLPTNLADGTYVPEELQGATSVGNGAFVAENGDLYDANQVQDALLGALKTTPPYDMNRSFVQTADASTPTGGIGDATPLPREAAAVEGIKSLGIDYLKAPEGLGFLKELGVNGAVGLSPEKPFTRTNPYSGQQEAATDPEYEPRLVDLLGLNSNRAPWATTVPMSKPDTEFNDRMSRWMGGGIDGMSALDADGNPIAIKGVYSAPYDPSDPESFARADDQISHQVKPGTEPYKGFDPRSALEKLLGLGNSGSGSKSSSGEKKSGGLGSLSDILKLGTKLVGGGAQVAQILGGKGGSGVAGNRDRGADGMRISRAAGSGRKNKATGGLLQMARGGRMSGGQDDVVPINAAPGEYVFDADVVAALGDGNTQAGAAKLDQMRQNIRKHKRSAGAKSIPPKSKNISDYLKGAK